VVKTGKEHINQHINQHDEQGKICPSPSYAAFQLQSYVGAGDQNTDQTTATGGNIIEPALLFSLALPSSSSTTSTAVISPPTSTESRGQKRRQSDNAPYTSSTTPAKRLKDWRKKTGVEIGEKEKTLAETLAEIESEEVEVRKLNNVLAGRRGKMTFSDGEHTFSHQAEKILMKSKIDSLSEELNTKGKRIMRNQNKKIYLGFLQNLSATRKEYLKLVQAEKEEVKTVI